MRSVVCVTACRRRRQNRVGVQLGAAFAGGALTCLTLACAAFTAATSSWRPCKSASNRLGFGDFDGARLQRCMQVAVPFRSAWNKSPLASDVPHDFSQKVMPSMRGISMSSTITSILSLHKYHRARDIMTTARMPAFTYLIVHDHYFYFCIFYRRNITAEFFAASGS